jgi:diguanylate cyclase (GGDEF)-like protein
LQRSVRGEDTVARLGGDEFVVVAQEIDAREAALALVEKLRLIIRQPLEIAGHSRTATASIGVALYPDDGADPDTLVSAADARMYRDKASREREAAIDSAMRSTRGQKRTSAFGQLD